MIHAMQQKIRELKQKNDVAILAHSYQSPAIQEVADLVGDSFALSVKAQQLSQKTLILCGVRFMADAIKLLNPEKKVLLANPTAGCPMAEQLDPADITAYRTAHPHCKVVAYINTTTELKAVSDVCVTSSSALKVVGKMDAKEILFIPDRNLGSFVAAAFPEKNFTFMDGCCPVHASVSGEEAAAAKRQYPDYQLLCHPELPADVCAQADLVGSTAAILAYARTHNSNCIIGTEVNIAKTLSLEFPDRDFPLLSKKLLCPDMAMTSLGDVYHCLTEKGGEEIRLDSQLAEAAVRPIREMIRLSK